MNRIEENLRVLSQLGGAVGVTAGTATAYTLAADPPLQNLDDLVAIHIKAHIDSGASPTINVNGLGPKPLLDAGGSPAVLKADSTYSFRYSTTANGGNGAFILQGGGGLTGQIKIKHTQPAVKLFDTNTNDEVWLMYDANKFYVQLRDASGTWVRDILSIDKTSALSNNNIVVNEGTLSGTYSQRQVLDINMGSGNWVHVARINATGRPQITWERSAQRGAAFMVYNGANSGDLRYLLEVMEDGMVNLNRIRILSTTDSSETSTAHPFQIGPDSGTHVQLDNNELEFMNGNAYGDGYINGNIVNIGGKLRGGSGVAAQANNGGWKNIATSAHTNSTHMTFSTGNPSGGTDGDVHFTY